MPRAAVFLIAALIVLPPAEAKAQRNVDQARQLRDQLSDDKKQRQATQRRIEELSAHINASETRLRTLDRAIRDNEEASADSRLKQRIALSQLQAQLDKLKPLLRQSHRLGRGAEIRMWLQLDDMEQLSKMRHFHRLIKGRHEGRLATYRRTFRKYNLILENFRARDAKLREQQVEYATQRRALERELASAEVEFKNLQRRIKSNEAELRRLLKRIRSPTPPPIQHGVFSARKGVMAWPVSGKLQNAFGQQRARGRLSPWKGVRIKAAPGDQVRAIHDGRVVYSGWLGGMGLLMILDHGDNFLSLYANSHTLLHKKGDAVKTGDAIATIGKSGDFDEGELYFELRHKEQAISPNSWFKR